MNLQGLLDHKDNTIECADDVLAGFAVEWHAACNRQQQGAAPTMVACFAIIKATPDGCEDIMGLG